jgi:hypothetical protein
MRMFIWVEGPDDSRFVESTLKVAAASHYDDIRVVQYSRLRKDKVDQYITAIRAMKTADYLFLGDMDLRASIEEAKQALLMKFKALEGSKIVIVGSEIESWYLAGLDQELARTHGLNIPLRTDNVSKEQFNTLIPSSFSSRIDWMIEILARFSVYSARSRNSTFEHFASDQMCGIVSCLPSCCATLPLDNCPHC